MAAADRSAHHSGASVEIDLDGFGLIGQIWMEYYGDIAFQSLKKSTIDLADCLVVETVKRQNITDPFPRHVPDGQFRLPGPSNSLKGFILIKARIQFVVSMIPFVLLPVS